MSRRGSASHKGQSEAHFWDLMNALNYALELKTPGAGAAGCRSRPLGMGAAPWAGASIPEEKAEDLPSWLLQKGTRTYLPLFTSVKTAEAEAATAARPMAEHGCGKPWHRP